MAALPSPPCPSLEFKLFAQQLPLSNFPRATQRLFHTLATEISCQDTTRASGFSVGFYVQSRHLAVLPFNGPSFRLAITGR